MTCDTVIVARPIAYSAGRHLRRRLSHAGMKDLAAAIRVHGDRHSLLHEGELLTLHRNCTQMHRAFAQSSRILASSNRSSTATAAAGSSRHIERGREALWGGLTVADG